MSSGRHLVITITLPLPRWLPQTPAAGQEGRLTRQLLESPPFEINAQLCTFPQPAADPAADPAPFPPTIAPTVAATKVRCL